MPKGRPWRYTELEILKENWDKVKIGELEDLLPGRTRKAIMREAEKLQLKGQLTYKIKRHGQADNRTKRTKDLTKETDWGDSGWGGKAGWDSDGDVKDGDKKKT